MEFSRQKYWSGLPFPTPRDLPNPRIKTASPTPPALQVRMKGKRTENYRFTK